MKLKGAKKIQVKKKKGYEVEENEEKLDGKGLKGTGGRRDGGEGERSGGGAREVVTASDIADEV